MILPGSNPPHRTSARTAMTWAIAAVLAVGCGVSKTADGGAAGDAAGSGGASGSGTGGTGGRTFDAAAFDINLDGLSLDGFSLDGFGSDISITTCPAGVKTGDACTSGETFCAGSG